MSNDLISVIIPSYNIEKYLGKCLDSLIIQTYQYIEIIIVNDGSTDGTLNVAKKYQNSDSRIKIVNQKNKGLSGARHSGLNVANGKWIIFVDGDDWLDIECFNICSKYFDDNIDIVMFPYIREYKNTHLKVEVFNEDYIEFNKSEIKSVLIRRLTGPIENELKRPNRLEDLNPVWNKIYRRNIIDECNFVDTKKAGTEDLLFNLTVFSAACKVIFTKETYYHYNKENSSSLTRKYNENLFNGFKYQYNCIKEYLKKESLENEIYLQALNNRIVINTIALSRNIVISNLKRNEKIQKLKELLEDDIYKNAFDSFEFERVGKLWKIFFWCCKVKAVILLYYIVSMGDNFKYKIK